LLALPAPSRMPPPAEIERKRERERERARERERERERGLSIPHGAPPSFNLGCRRLRREQDVVVNTNTPAMYRGTSLIRNNPPPLGSP